MATGYLALRDNLGASYKAASGAYALLLNHTGAANTAAGAYALYSNNSGSNNAAVGYNALRFNTTGAFNTAGNILIGHAGGSAAENKTTHIGTAQTKAFIAGIRGVTTGVSDAVTVMIDSKGQLGTVKSSARYKEDIHDMAAYSSRLYQLRPVTYRYKEATEDGQKLLESGLVAEEVATVYPDLVVRNADGQVETAPYHKLTPMLLNELEQHQQELQALVARNAALEAQVQHLQAALDRQDADLAARLTRLEASLQPTYTAVRR